MIFDSHCHPQFSQYENDRDEMIARSIHQGVSMICVGTNLGTSRQAIELAQEHDSVWATAGLHPNDIDQQLTTDNLQQFELLLKEPKVVAVGEVGLDYYRTPESEKQEIQKEVFGKFLDLAIKFDKPIIIHSRDSAKGSADKVHSDMIEILNTRYLIHNTKVRGVAHSFTGSIDEAEKYLNLGFYLGFNGIITFARQYDDMIKSVPLERILLETDAPYLAPVPHRGKRNEPLFVVEVAKKLAEIKNLPLEQVIEQTALNTRKLFSI